MPGGQERSSEASSVVGVEHCWGGRFIAEPELVRLRVLESDRDWGRSSRP